MLSRAEIQYLQGQKQVSKSYGRKLKCIIRKKLEILCNEFPLLSILFANEVRPVLYGLKLGEFNPSKRCNENLAKPNQQLEVREHATKFSNFQLDAIELGAKSLVERDGVEGSKTYDQSQIVHAATEFSNNKSNDATKNSNSDEKRRRERDLNSVAILEETTISYIRS